MPALMVSEIRVKSPEKLADYMAQTKDLATRFGAKMLAQGAFARHLTSTEAHDRVVVAQFPDIAALNAWYESPEYAKLVPLREAGSDMRMTAYVLPDE